jgi:zinc transport system substrate-binding protein
MWKLLSLLLLVPTAGLAEPLRVFASVVPIQTFVEKIGGEHVDAWAMVRPGYNPHTYEPTPQQISALAGAVLYVRTGVPFEDAWMERIRSANPGMEVLDARAGISLRALDARSDDEHGRDGAHHADEQDPHVWTSPPLVRHMVGAIRDKLSELDPGHAAELAHNHDAFVAELDALDRDLHALLDPLPNRRFLVFHPAWGYFADTYGLTQVPIEREGKRPGARALAALNGRMTILVVSHDIAFISQYVSRVACVNRTLVCHRTDAIDGAVIQELYGEKVRMIAHAH